MISLNWPIVITYTIINYLLIILVLPFNSVLATILLFALIGFWSRLPGAGIHDPFWVFYSLDLVDIFALIIAINMGVPLAVLFVWVVNTIPRFAGVYPPWSAIFEDNASQTIGCMVAPFIFSMTGDIFITMIWYTTIRNAITLPTSYFLRPKPFIEWIIGWTTWFFAIYLINGFYAKIFGGHFDKLLKGGTGFDWLLFFFATVVILIFSICIFGLSPKKITKDISKNVIKIAKRHIKIKPKKEYKDDNEINFIKESLK